MHKHGKNPSSTHHKRWSTLGHACILHVMLLATMVRCCGMCAWSLALLHGNRQGRRSIGREDDQHCCKSMSNRLHAAALRTASSLCCHRSTTAGTAAPTATACIQHHTYDLQLDDLAIKLHSADFLQAATTKGWVWSTAHLPPRCCCIQPLPFTYKVHSNSADVALSVCVILKKNKSTTQIIVGWVNRVEEEGCAAQAHHLTLLTANLSSKQDFPTPESPIRRSCKKEKGQSQERRTWGLHAHTKVFAHLEQVVAVCSSNEQTRRVSKHT